MSNETTEMWRDHRQHVQKQRRKTANKNQSVLSGHPLLEEKNGGDVYLYRVNGKVKVQYWPSSEMWMIGNEKHYGGAKKFLSFIASIH